ncbi:MAG: hypothetical protein NT148_01355, partial [Candidatus Nealsonbacteria bacterium]|nr:hypothetical protein [Candidatus Nealsonbacteria bacterium]
MENNQNMPNNYFNVEAEPKKGIPTWLGLLIIIIIATVVGLGILGYQYYTQNQIPVATETPAVAAITDSSLKNATLSYPNPYDESKNDTIKLVDGHALLSDEGGIKPRVYDVAKTAIGDLNNDGVAEGVIGVYQGFGANIIAPVIFVLSEKNGVLEQIDSVFMPEGAIDSEIKSLSINNGILSVNLFVISENDLQNHPHSEWQPTVDKTFQYKLVDGKLTDAAIGWEKYTNNEYGFNISFPDSWKGYSLEKSSWTGRLIDGDTQYTGVQLIFKNQTLASEKNFYGIPIMVITPDVWKLISEEKVAVSAAPIGPAKIGENQKYVFATPPR